MWYKQASNIANWFALFLLQICFSGGILVAQPMPLSQQAQQTPPQPTRWDRIREFLSIFWPWVFAALVIAVVGMTVSWGRSVENRLPESNTIQAAVSSGVREGLGAVNVRLDSHESRLTALEKAPVQQVTSATTEPEGFITSVKEWANGVFATREETESIEKRVAVLEAGAKPAQIPAAPAVKQAPTQAPATKSVTPTTAAPAPVATKSATQAPASAPAPAAPAAPAQQVAPATTAVSSGMTPEEKERLATLETQVASNTKGVATNAAAIGALDSRLTALESQVAEILPRLKSLSGRVVEAPPTLGGYMPAKEIGRSLGYEVRWTPERKDDAGGTIAESVFLSKGGNVVAAAKFGSDNYYVSPCGMESRLFIAGRPPVKRSGVAYLPERLFEELQTRAAKCS